ncbi:MAG: hypothetical protein NVS3B10_05130 [Polyangiales bacterium]
MARSRLVLLTLVALGLASCIRYVPGTLRARHRRWATTREVGCLDVAAEIVGDPHVDPSSPIVDVQFGNRCKGGVHVDLGKLAVVARWSGGPPVSLHAYDPRHEIEPLPLAPGALGHEAIAFPAPRDETRPPTTVCVDFGAIDADEPQIDARACFSRVAGGMLPDDGDGA